MAAVKLLLLIASLHADMSGSLQVNRYHSDSGVSVITPAFEVKGGWDERNELSLRYNLDSVAAASFDYSKAKTHKDALHGPGTCMSCHAPTDAMSGATKSFVETRHGLQVGVSRRQGEHKFSASYELNRENDYASDGANLRWQGDFAGRDSTLTLGLALLKDRIGSSMSALSETLDTYGGDIGFTQILGPETVALLNYSPAIAQGYQQNPYAFVQVGTNYAIPSPVSQPRTKRRQDISATLKQGLPWDSAAQADYRFYSDDWGVIAHTFELNWTKAFGSLMIEPMLRFYLQPQGAYFFENHYQVAKLYMTRDLKLSAFSTSLFGLSLKGAFAEHWGTQLSYAYYTRADSLDYSLYYADKPESAHIVQVVFTYQ